MNLTNDQTLQIKSYVNKIHQICYIWLKINAQVYCAISDFFFFPPLQDFSSSEAVHFVEIYSSAKVTF